MKTIAKKTHSEMERELGRTQSEDIARAEIVKGTRPDSPISVRLSAPLLEALDHLAHKEHRKRGNLIQHILWEYVHANSK